jgi:hypothetical protein
MITVSSDDDIPLDIIVSGVISMDYDHDVLIGLLSDRLVTPLKKFRSP